MMFSLQGKTALVTGSSRGIGKAAALALAQAGAKVILHGSKPGEKLSQTAAMIPGSAVITADFTAPDGAELLAKELEAKKLVPDILILNASVQSYTGIDNFDSAAFTTMMHANVESSYTLIRLLSPAMRAKKWGRILFVGSINGIRPAARLSVYGSTKAALQNLAACCAKEFAPDQVTVNSILPGVITTDRNAAALSNKEFADSLQMQIPARRFGTPEDCAGVLVFLASDAASYITGAEIPVAGGWQL